MNASGFSDGFILMMPLWFEREGISKAILLETAFLSPLVGLQINCLLHAFLLLRPKLTQWTRERATQWAAVCLSV